MRHAQRRAPPPLFGGTTEGARAPFLAYAFARWVIAVQRRDGDKGIGLLFVVDVDDPDATLEGNAFYFSAVDALFKLKHGDVLLFNPREYHSITEAFLSTVPKRRASQPCRYVLSFYTNPSHMSLISCHPARAPATRS